MRQFVSTPSNEAPVTEAGSRGPVARILIVNGSEEHLNALEHVLEGVGDSLNRASHAREALEILKTGEYALVFIDLRNADPAGFEVARMIRQDPHLEEFPIIFTAETALAPAEIDRAYDLGGYDVLMAPINPIAVRTKARVFVELHRSKCELALRIATRTADLERRVTERTASLSESVRELNTFAYTVAHDLRAPLRAIHSFGQLLLEDYGPALDELGKSYLRQMIESSGRMDLLIRDLLEYSRVSRQEVRIEPVDVGQVVDQVLLEMNAELIERKAVVRIVRPLGWVLAHVVTFAQAISNLLSNAAKFVPPGIEPHILIRAEPRGNRIRLWIEDNGIGIEPEYREKIFTIFERIHPLSAYAGTGIGLAIVRRGIERMGGQTGVESTLGRGSQFFIELPIPEGHPRPATGVPLER